MKRQLLTLGALLVMSAFVSAAEWLTDYGQALKLAKEQNKAVLMDFTGSDWCGWCMKLDREVFSTSEFQNFADKRLVLLKVDFPRRRALPADQTAHNDRLASRFGVQAFPTIIVLRPDGSKAGQLGYEPGGPRRFIASVEKSIR
jgi:thioredoxin-related protein